MQNWTNPEKFVLRLMQLKFMVFCKFKGTNEENIDLNLHMTSTFSIHGKYSHFQKPSVSSLAASNKLWSSCA